MPIFVEFDWVGNSPQILTESRILAISAKVQQKIG